MNEHVVREGAMNESLNLAEKMGVVSPELEISDIMSVDKLKIVSGKVSLPDGSEWKLIRDTYQRSRGGNSVMLAIGCAKCDKGIMIYQKDGPGPLKRCYLDRIAWKAGGGVEESRELWKNNPLQCPHCLVKIGSPMVYKKERRSAISLDPQAFRKKVYAR